MFNSKSKTYLLLVAVLGVWGTIGYKIVNGLSPDVPEVNTETFSNSFNPKPIAKTEHFDIQPTTRDPFLGTLSSPKPLQQKVNKPQTPKPNRTPITITYGGLIKKQNSYKPVFVVNINNQQHLLKAGQVVDSVTLVRGTTKEIVVRYHNQTQTISRN